MSVSDSKQVAKLLTDANNLPRVPKGSYSCPADDGSYYQLQFSYSNGDRLTIYAERGGCEVVGYANHPDYSPAWSLTDHRLLSDLDALFR